MKRFLLVLVVLSVVMLLFVALTGSKEHAVGEITESVSVTPGEATVVVEAGTAKEEVEVEKNIAAGKDESIREQTYSEEDLNDIFSRDETEGAAGEVSSALSEEEREKMRPPFIDNQDGVVMGSPTEDSINALAAEMRYDAGTNAIQAAELLLSSDKPGLGLVAAKILIQEGGAWTESAFNAIRQHPDIAVPLYAWQGLMEGGRIAEADALADELVKRMGGTREWARLLEQTTLPGTAVRGLVHVAGITRESGELGEILQALVTNTDNDYSGRMRALREYEFMLPFEEYRDRVYEELARETEVADPVWSEGLRRLARDLEGPEPVLTAPKVVTPGDIDMMVAHEYPATLEDIALELEMAMRNTDTTYTPGLVERLIRLVEERSRGPLDESEKVALQRIVNISGVIVESESRDAANLLPPGEAQVGR